MGVGLKSKGQISIEFILIILIVLIYIHSVIQPTAKAAAQSTEDVARLAQTKLAAQKLGAAINELQANQSDGKKTIELFVPKDGTVTCNGSANVIEFSATMSSLRNPQGCTNKVCSGSVKLITGAGSGLSCFGGSNASNVFREVTVSKTNSGIDVSYVST